MNFQKTIIKEQKNLFSQMLFLLWISTHFMPLISFDTPCKDQKISGLLMFLGGIKRDQWHEIG